jgi:hypothetical protein
MDVCLLCVLYSQDKRQSQDNQHKEVRTKYKARTKKKNPGGGENFRTRPWGLPCLLYNGYRVSFPKVKRQGLKRGYSYTSTPPLGLHGLFLGRTLPFFFTLPLTCPLIVSTDRYFCIVCTLY